MNRSAKNVSQLAGYGYTDDGNLLIELKPVDVQGAMYTTRARVTKDGQIALANIIEGKVEQAVQFNDIQQGIDALLTQFVASENIAHDNGFGEQGEPLKYLEDVENFEDAFAEAVAI